MCGHLPHMPALRAWHAERQLLGSHLLQTLAGTELAALPTLVWKQLATKKCDAVRGPPLLLRHQVRDS